MKNLLDEIEGEVKDGKLHVTHWPKPRVSNPNLLSQAFEQYERDMAKPENKWRK